MTTSASSPPFPPPSIRPLVAEIAALLKQRRQTVCVAETAAGGLISASLLSVPGASAIYRGGLTLYTLESRVAFAGWTPHDLDSYRGPTPAVVTSLAENVRATLGADFCVAESGTAGPGPGRGSRPGYVALAVASEGRTVTREVDTGLGGEREANMVGFAREALGLLREVVGGGGGGGEGGGAEGVVRIRE